MEDYSCDFLICRYNYLKMKDNIGGQKRALANSIGHYFADIERSDQRDVLIRKIKSRCAFTRVPWHARGLIPEVEVDLLSRLANKSTDVSLTVDIAGRATLGVFRRRGSRSKSGRPRSRHGNKQLLKALLRARHTHALAEVECRTHPVIRVGWAPFFH